MSTGQYIRNNTVLGDDAMANTLNPSQTIGYDNTAYGYNVLKNLQSNINENSAFGSQALESAFGGENSAFGAYAGAEIGVGTENALFGNWAGRFMSGKSNTAHGYRALAGDKRSNNIPGPIASGGFNTAIGAEAMRYYPNGDDNVAVGYSALVRIDNGDNNTAIGSGAGSSITTGNNNTFIGKGADASGLNPGNAQQRTAIGAGALADTNNTIILGTIENVGIGITNPDSRLHVQINQDQINQAPSNPEQSYPAIHAKGVPGILAEGSVSTAYAIHAKGSSEAPAIYVEGGTGGTEVPAPGAPAIYAKGPGGYPAILAEASGTAAAIYAQGSTTDPAIHARGTDATVGLFAEGSPGIRAQKIGSTQDPAIYAMGSEEGYAIQAMTSGTVAAIRAEGNSSAPAIYAMGSGSFPVIHAEGTDSGPAIHAENTSGPAIQADGTIEANGPTSGPAIQATGGLGRAIEAQSTSATAIYAVGSPGIDAEGVGTSPAIHAVGSSGAPGIRVEGSGSASSVTDAAAIYAQGSNANAIYALTTGSAPAIQAKGATYSPSLSVLGAALFVDGGIRAKVRFVSVVANGTYQIESDDYIMIFYGIITGTVTANLPQANVQDGQMFIIRNYSGSNFFAISTQGSTYGIAKPRATYPASTPLTTWEITDSTGAGYHGAVMLVFYQGIYFVLLYTD